MSETRSDGTGTAPPSVAFVVSRLGYSIGQALADGLRPAGIEPPHLGLLRILQSTEGESQRSIGDRLNIAPNRMVMLVDQLEALGAVERRRHPSDRRAWTLRLTPEGLELLEQAMRVALGVEEALCRDLDPAERGQLLELLGRLHEPTGDVPPGVHPGLSG
jgi:DNA-binding MarR family transcriptional regulator